MYITKMLNLYDYLFILKNYTPSLKIRFCNILIFFRNYQTYNSNDIKLSIAKL